jgi:hypothetical protein
MNIPSVALFVVHFRNFRNSNFKIASLKNWGLDSNTDLSVSEVESFQITAFALSNSTQTI